MRTLKRLILLAILFCALAASPGALMAQEYEPMVLDRVVAVVNDEVITWIELYHAMEFEMGSRFTELSDEQKRRFFKENAESLLQVLVEQRLQLQEAEKLNIEVAPEEVDKALDNIRDKYGMNSEEFKAWLSREGSSPGKYRELIRNQIIISRLVDREVKRKVVLSKDEVRGELKRLNLKEGVYYNLGQIFFRLEQSERFERIEKKVEEVMEALRQGVDFGKTAQKYSEEPAAQFGGRLGLVPEDQLAPEFREALAGLSPGQVSPPFRTSRGVHIVFFMGRQDAREVVLEKRFDSEYREWLRKLRERSFVEVRL
jgi:peptidyl-prolyl cis-trans isomerase SurA